jgi:hypothetical protein
METIRRPRYHRATEPPPLRFQPRDEAILQTILDLDGVVARRHIQALFWPGKSQQALQVRLSKLYHNGYLNWPNRTQHNTYPIPEPILWLGWRGILHLALRRGILLTPLTRLNENQLRTLQKELREQGLRWLREPNWSCLPHDLKVIDFRLDVSQSVQASPVLKLEQWISESVFRADPDRIRFSFRGNNGKVYQKKKGVIPDGFFELVNAERQSLGQPAKVRFLLELDMATHDTPSFGVEKVAAGVAYVRSAEYKARFGSNSGRWLIVTTGMRRLKNLMKQTTTYAPRDANLFYFATQADAHQYDVLTDPIWWQPGKNEPRSLPIL